MAGQEEKNSKGEIKAKDTLPLKEARKIVKEIKKNEIKPIRTFSFSRRFPFIKTYLFWEAKNV